MRLPILTRLKIAWARHMTRPAPPPEDIGKKRAMRRGHRPIPIELGFKLHADGTVYQLRRDGRPAEKVSDEHMIGAVHREYRILVDMARKANFQGGHPLDVAQRS